MAAYRPATQEVADAVLRQVLRNPTAVVHPQQLQVLDCVLRHRDTLAVLRTGAGKTAIYQLAQRLLNNAKGGMVVIVEPLTALVMDQAAHTAAGASPRTFRLSSDMTQREQLLVLHAIEQGKVDYLYVSPERWVTLVSEGFFEGRGGERLMLLVIDEAHCVCEWDTFRADYARLGETWRALLAKLRKQLPLLALTATAPPFVRRIICESLLIEHQLIGSVKRPELFFGAVESNCPDELLRRIETRLRTSAPRSAVLVYVPTVRLAKQLDKRLGPALRARGTVCELYHAQMPDARRRAVESAFARGEMQVGFVTKAFSMGINRSDVRDVIHYCGTEDMVSYIQEAGRGGRDGQLAHATVMWTERAFGHRRLLKLLSKETRPERRVEIHRRFFEAEAMCKATTCRHAFLQLAMGEEPDPPAASCNCDNCRSGASLLPPEDVAHEWHTVYGLFAQNGELRHCKDGAGIVHLVETLERQTMPRRSASWWRGLVLTLVLRRALELVPHVTEACRLRPAAQLQRPVPLSLPRS